LHTLSKMESHSQYPLRCVSVTPECLPAGVVSLLAVTFIPAPRSSAMRLGSFLCLLPDPAKCLQTSKRYERLSTKDAVRPM